MLNTDSIRDKILGDARAGAQQTLSDAEQRARQIKEAGEQRISAARSRALDDADAQAEEMRDRMLRMAELDMRKELLGVKREVIDEAFDKALGRMRAMDVVTAREFARSELLACAAGGESIVFDACDEKVYTPEFVASVNAQLVKEGRPGGLTIDPERRAIGGGFILKAGGAEIMCTYETIMAQARAALEGDVLKLLFPEV